MRVLAVDDDPNDLRYIRENLAKSGYDPVVTGEPQEALRLVAEERPDLVLLDLVLPGADGMELMKDILAVADIPVIFLSAYGREEVVARAFDMGAADYVVKPFSPTELSARIRATLRRRAASEPAEPYALGDLVIDYASRSVTLAGRPVELAAMEYRMLAELSANAGRVLTYQYLAERVWGERGRRRHAAHAHAYQQAPAQAGRRRRQTEPTSSPSAASATGCPRGRDGETASGRGIASHRGSATTISKYRLRP